MEGNVGFTFGGDIVLADGASVEADGGASELHDDGRDMSNAPGTACKVMLK